MILLSAISFGIMPMFSQLSLKEGMNISALLFWRFLIATIAIWLYIFLKNIPYMTSKRHLFYLIVLSAIGYMGTSATLYMAYTYISGSLATIIFFIHPAMITAYEIFILKKKEDIRKVLSLIVATLGLILVVGNINIHINLTGIILSLLSAVFYSFYVLGLEEKRTAATNSIVVTGYVLLFTSMIYFIECSIKQNISFPPTIKSWYYIIILSVISTVIATITFCKGIRLVGPSTGVIISTFEPVFACIIGFFIMGELLTLSMIIGGIFILSAILILQIPKTTIHQLLKFKKSRLS